MNQQEMIGRETGFSLSSFTLLVKVILEEGNEEEEGNGSFSYREKESDRRYMFTWKQCC